VSRGRREGRQEASSGTPEVAVATIPTAERTVEALLAESPQIEAAGGSHPGLQRPGNEDAFTFGRVGRFLEITETNLPPSPITGRMEQVGWFAVVADGMGGRAAGEVASRTALAAAFEATLRRTTWLSRVTGDDLQEILDRMRALIERVHDAVSEVARSDRSLSGMGTTFSLARIAGASLIIGHVGDSRIYLLRRGVLRQLTKDQTTAQLLADMGEIRPEEVARHSASHILTQAIGSGKPIQAEVRHVWLLEGDALLLATDGLTGVVDETEIAAAMALDEPPKSVVDRLIARALEGGAPDNVTVVFARVLRLPPRPNPSDTTDTST
jgi:serine/threonine protein phosphatase PrpC